MHDKLETSCDLLLQNIRDSGLNYNCQLTPFSMYVTIRKSFIKSRTSLINSTHSLNVCRKSESSELQEKYDKLLIKQKCLEQGYNNLKSDLEHVIEECDEKNKGIENLENLKDKLNS